MQCMASQSGSEIDELGWESRLSFWQLRRWVGACVGLVFLPCIYRFFYYVFIVTPQAKARASAALQGVDECTEALATIRSGEYLRMAPCAPKVIMFVLACSHSLSLTHSLNTFTPPHPLSFKPTLNLFSISSQSACLLRSRVGASER
jgi:hypothetical protein